MLKFHVITLFPEAVEAFAKSSMLKRAQEKRHIKIHAVNPRDYTSDKHHTTDDRPYGGGPGMVMKAEPIVRAVEMTLRRAKSISRKTKILVLSPRGKQFTATEAAGFAKRYKDIVLIAGHYEGIDERVMKILRPTEISVGPYVLTGGELPAMTIVDAVSRHVPGVLGKRESLEERRVTSGTTYTRPDVFVWKGKKYSVPEVLTRGNHKEIENWRRGGQKT